MPNWILRTAAWARAVALFTQRFSSIIKAIEFGLSFTCVISAFSAGGDMTIVFILIFFGCFFAAIGILQIVSMSLKNRITFCVGVILPFFLIYVFLHEHHAHDQDTGVAVLALQQQINEMERQQKMIRNPAPLEPDNKTVKNVCNSSYNVNIGGNIFGANNLPYTAIETFGEPYLILDRSGNGMSATFNLYDEQDRVLAEVKENNVLIPPINLSYMRVRHDLHTLEVADIYGVTRLTIYYENKSNIIVNGVFYRHGIRFVADESGITFPGQNKISAMSACGAVIGLSLN